MDPDPGGRRAAPSSAKSHTPSTIMRPEMRVRPRR